MRSSEQAKGSVAGVPVLGELAAIGSALCWSTSSVLLKGPSRRLRAVYLTAYRMVFTALVAVLAAAAAGQLDDIVHIPVGAVLILVSSAAVVIVGDVAFFRAFAQDDLSRVFTVTTGLYILFSVVATVLFVHGPPTWLTVLGGVLVVVGVSLISESRQGAATKPGAKPDRRMPLYALMLSVLTAILWTGACLH